MAEPEGQNPEKRTFAPEEREAHKRETRVAGSLGSLLSGLGSGKSEGGGGTNESASTSTSTSAVTSDKANGSNFGALKNTGSRWSDFQRKKNTGGNNFSSVSAEKNSAMGWFAAGESVEGGDSQQGHALGKDEFLHWGEAKALDQDLDPEWLSYEHKKLDERFGEGIVTVKYTGDGTLGYYCELCFATMNNMKPLEAHCSGMKHLKKKDMFEKSKASGEPSLLGRRREGDAPGSERDHVPPRDERDRLHMNPRDRPGRDGWDRHPRDERDRYYRDERDRYSRDERDRYPRDERDPYPRDERDSYSRDERDRYPRDEYDRYSRDERDRYSRDPWDQYSRDSRDRRSREPYDRRDYDSADRQLPYSVDYKHQDKRPRLDGPDDRQPVSYPPRVPTPPPARLSPPIISKPLETNLAGGPAAALLSKLAQCTIKNENDASLASDVINMLLKSLKGYHAKCGEKTVSDLMEQAEIKLGTAKAIRSVKRTTPSSQPLDAISAAMLTLRQGSANFPSLI